MQRIRKAVKSVVISWLKEGKTELHGFYTRFWFDSGYDVYLQKGRGKVKLHPTGYAKKQARKSVKRTKLRNIVKKGYHSEEERPIASSPSESDDSELDIVARENMMTGCAAARRWGPGRDSSVDDDEDSDSHDASSSAPDESSAEVAESESSDSIAEHARQPVRQTRHKPSANKNIATRNKVYDEDKQMKPDRTKVKPQAMRRGFDEIHYMKVTGAGYATERDDLKYLNESGAESVEESKHSSHSVKQSHKPESDSDSESDEVINEKLGLLNEGIKDNLKEMCVWLSLTSRLQIATKNQNTKNMISLKTLPFQMLQKERDWSNELSLVEATTSNRLQTWSELLIKRASKSLTATTTCCWTDCSSTSDPSRCRAETKKKKLSESSSSPDSETEDLRQVSTFQGCLALARLQLRSKLSKSWTKNAKSGSSLSTSTGCSWTTRAWCTVWSTKKSQARSTNRRRLQFCLTTTSRRKIYRRRSWSTSKWLCYSSMSSMHLLLNKQTLLYNLFDWPSNK